MISEVNAKKKITLKLFHHAILVLKSQPAHFLLEIAYSEHGRVPIRILPRCVARQRTKLHTMDQSWIKAYRSFHLVHLGFCYKVETTESGRVMKKVTSLFQILNKIIITAIVKGLSIIPSSPTSLISPLRFFLHFSVFGKILTLD